MTSQMEIQIGKKGLTLELLEDLKKRFGKKKVSNIKVSVLRSAREKGREDVKIYSERIDEFLGDNFTTKILGFSIFIKKWRKARNKK